jgi:hypothetical protein
MQSPTVGPRETGTTVSVEKLAGKQELPRDVLQAIHHLAQRQQPLGHSDAQLRERLNQLQELHVLPEHRTQSDPDSEGETESSD